MASGFTRAVVSLLARDRSDKKWLLRSLRLHIARSRAGAEASFRSTRNMRLALGQYLLCGAYDSPAKTIVAPIGAIAVYAAAIAYMIFWK